MIIKILITKDFKIILYKNQIKPNLHGYRLEELVLIVNLVKLILKISKSKMNSYYNCQKKLILKLNKNCKMELANQKFRVNINFYYANKFKIQVISQNILLIIKKF